MALGATNVKRKILMERQILPYPTYMGTEKRGDELLNSKRLQGLR